MSVSMPPMEPRQGPRAWLGKDMADNPESWQYELTDSDIEDLEQAADTFNALGRDLGTIDKASFLLLWSKGVVSS